MSLRQGQQTCLLSARKVFWGKLLYDKKVVFLLSDYSELEDKELGVSEKHFRIFSKIAFEESTGTVCKTVSFKKLLWN